MVTHRRVLVPVVAALAVLPLGLAGCSGEVRDVPVSAAGTSSAPVGPLLDAPVRPTPPSDTTYLRRVDRLTGGLSPKSVVSNHHGAVIANNMMYNHSVTVYDARSRRVAATVSDDVDLAALGVPGHPGVSRGAPVEAAFTRDGRQGYVSNYSMYGEGFGPEGKDSCRPGDGTSPSYLYRLDLPQARFDQAIAVGAVPKYVAVTPDQRYVLVSNWCSWTMSVVDRAAGREVAQVPIGAYPRGIAVSPDSRTAYVTAMGTSHVFRVDLTAAPKDMRAVVHSTPGVRVRHVAVDPQGRYLYAVSSGRNNGDGTTNVAKIDAATGQVVATAVPGREPRSLALSPDGRAAYVVAYDDGAVVKVRTDTMQVVQRVRTDGHPIGVTYDPATASVWACSYTGSVLVLDDTGTDPLAATGTVEGPAAGAGTGSAGPTAGPSASGADAGSGA